MNTFDISNFSFDGSPKNDGFGFTWVNPMFTITPHYRRIHSNITGFQFHDIAQSWAYGVMYVWGSGTEVINLSGFRYSNVSTSLFYLQLMYQYSITIDDFEYKDAENHPAEAVNVITFGDLSVGNLKFENYTNHGFGQFSPLGLTVGSGSNVVVSGIMINNVEISNVPVVNLPAEPLTFDIRD